MAKIVVFVPSSRMLKQAEDLIRERHLEACAISTDSDHILGILEKERMRGAQVAVARGNHAHLIKESTDMPLSEMCLSGQELLLLIHKAMSLCESRDDLIALVGFYNMFTDIEPIKRVLGVNARIYYASGSNDVLNTVRKAKADGAKVLIGGEIAMKCAQELGMRTLFLDSTRESLLTAILQAKRICFGIQSEQRKAQEIMSLINYSFDAVLRIDREGIVRIANGNAEIAFHIPVRQLTGRYILDLINVSEDHPLKKALLERKNAYSAMVTISDVEYVVNIATLYEENNYVGAILSMQRFGRFDALRDDALMREAARARRATHTIQEYTYASKSMRSLIEDAQHIARYDLPVLITGKYGTDCGRLAEAIHNAGRQQDKPFIRIDVSCMPTTLQLQNLTIAGGQDRHMTALEMASSGTMLIENVGMLCEQAQVLLLYILRNRWILGANGQPAFPVNCRIMATADETLIQAVQQDRFSRALYAELSRITLRVPSLSEREGDLAQIIDEQLLRFSKKHAKNVRLSAEARRILLSARWQGDEAEAADMLEKIVLFSLESEADAVLVERLMSYRVVMEKEEPEKYVPVYDEEEAELRGVLASCHGDRSLMAEALGISKTTLWRKMKKYKLI